MCIFHYSWALLLHCSHLVIKKIITVSYTDNENYFWVQPYNYSMVKQNYILQGFLCVNYLTHRKI